MSVSVSRTRQAVVCFMLFVASLLVTMRPAAVAPAERVIFGEERFTRSSGTPVTALRTFTASPLDAPFTLRIVSGEPDPRRPGATMNGARGTVRLNGVLIASSPDFARSSHIERAVPLQADNVLEVTLVGPAGSHLTLGITGLVHVSISGITPDNGPVDTPVLISGDGFDPVPANNQVSFNGVAALVTASTPTAIQTSVPEGATTGPVVVTTPNGSATSALFTVTSGHRLLISKSPEQQIYSRGQPITISAAVVDRHGQPVPGAVVTFESSPAEDDRAGNTFVYQSDGTFTITATAAVTGESLTASLLLTVQGQGPVIACTQPFDGAMLNGEPGTTLLFQGTVNSTNGVAHFAVNGVDVPVVDGAFSTPIVAAWGLNIVTLDSLDDVGTPAQKVCSFVLSNTWASEQLPTADTVSLKLVQSAVDDLSRADELDSLGDILHAIVNSDVAAETLHRTLQAANPLKPESCDSRTCTFLGCVCWYSSGVSYQASQLTGPSTTFATPVANSGLHTQTRFNDVVVRLRVTGDVAGIPYDTTGDVILDYVDIVSTFDVTLSNGRPRVTVRPGSVSANAGSVTTQFGQVDGWIMDNIIIPLAQGYLRDAIRNLLRDYVTNNFSQALDGVIGSLDVMLPATYAVRSMSATADITMNAGIAFSHSNGNSSRMLFGLGTRFVAPVAHARTSLGTPKLFPPNTLFDVAIAPGKSAGDAFHEVITGQALHALWRAGYFDAVLGGGALNGVIPAGVSVTTVASLPPVATIRPDARVEIAIGSLAVQLQHPTLFPGTVDGTVAGRVSCVPQINGGVLVLSACIVDELRFAAAQRLDAATFAQVEGLMRGILEAILPAAANGSVPSLPVPFFTLPASLGPFGLPVGATLGVVGPVVHTSGAHHVRIGSFGIR